MNVCENAQASQLKIGKDMLYIDDCGIAICPQDGPITDCIKSMQNNYVLTDEWGMSAYLGIQVDHKRTSNGLECHLTQPALINRIIASTLVKDQRLYDTPNDRILVAIRAVTLRKLSSTIDLLSVR